MTYLCRACSDAPEAIGLQSVTVVSQSECDVCVMSVDDEDAMHPTSFDVDNDDGFEDEVQENNDFAHDDDFEPNQGED